MIRHLTTLEQDAARTHLRARAKTKIAGRSVRSLVEYQGETWYYYDAHAESTVPDGVLLVLLSLDGKRIADGVRTDNVAAPKCLERYVVKDEEGNEGSVYACSKEHAEENAGDLEMTLTGEKEMHDDPSDQCAICGYQPESCRACLALSEQDEESHLTGRIKGRALDRHSLRHTG